MKIYEEDGYKVIETARGSIIKTLISNGEQGIVKKTTEEILTEMQYQQIVMFEVMATLYDEIQTLKEGI